MNYYHIPLLNPGYCKTLADQVKSLSENYNVVKQDYFYILGAASYQYKSNNPGYYRRAYQINPVLWKNFSDLYLSLLDKLSYFLQASVGYWEQSGLPGFHLINVGKQSPYFGGNPHFDLSYRQLLPHLTKLLPHFSFTLSLQQPEAGTGLNIWELHYNDIYNSSDPVKPDEAIKRVKKLTVPYTVGELVIFDGHYFHQIAPTEKTIPEDQRITLQGHCVQLNGGWGVYW